MVHALNEIHRVLIPGGRLIDLRPLADQWPIEIMSSRAQLEAGRVSDLPQGLEDDAAASRAISQAAAAGLFSLEHEESFPLSYYWDTPNSMQEYIDEEWVDFIAIDDAVWRNIRSLWAMADADARLRVRLKMLLARWRANS